MDLEQRFLITVAASPRSFSSAVGNPSAAPAVRGVVPYRPLDPRQIPRGDWPFFRYWSNRWLNSSNAFGCRWAGWACPNVSFLALLRHACGKLRMTRLRL